MRYQVSGYFEWDGVVRRRHRQKIDMIIEADSEKDAIDWAIDETIEFTEEEIDGEDSSALVVTLLPDLTPEDLDADERRENERMMHSLGIPTLFEVEVDA